MTDHPLIFSAPMIRALIDGRKTQTRRVFVPPAPFDVGDDIEIHIATGEFRPKYAAGDRLWVREGWRTHRDHDEINPGSLLDGKRCVLISYSNDADNEDWLGRHRSSIHMPRWASRLTLTVTAVRVERLQDISEWDARAEGWPGNPEPPYGCHHPTLWYRLLWNDIHGDGARAANPWIVALTFSVAHTNIDTMPKSEAA